MANFALAVLCALPLFGASIQLKNLNIPDQQNHNEAEATQKLSETMGMEKKTFEKLSPEQIQELRKLAFEKQMGEYLKELEEIRPNEKLPLELLENIYELIFDNRQLLNMNEDQAEKYFQLAISTSRLSGNKVQSLIGGLKDAPSDLHDTIIPQLPVLRASARPRGETELTEEWKKLKSP